MSAGECAREEYGLRRWVHESFDRLGALVGGLVYRRSKLFSQSLEAPALDEAVRQTTASVGSLQPGVWHESTAKGPAGTLKAAYYVHRWLGDSYPTILYIHGSGEQPYKFGRFNDNSFAKIFDKDFDEPVNLVLIAAPFHEDAQGAYIQALGHMKNYVGMLAATTALLHSLAEQVRAHGSPAVYAAGFSLGGWVANLHRAFFGHSVDRYIPMCAGARLDSIFAASAYKRLVCPEAVGSPELLRRLLNFDERFRASSIDCRPLLFRFDRFLQMEVHMPSYEGMEVAILEKGHFTGQQAIREMREHIVGSVASNPLDSRTAGR